MTTQTVTHTLSAARDAFITSMNRDTGGSDRVRYVAVLDAMLEWSSARPTQLKFRADESAKGVISFLRVGSNVVFWSARPMRGDGPKLEVLPRAASVLTPEQRAAAMDALNNHSREILETDDKLCIGFSAMKNPATRTAIFTMLDALLEQTAVATK